MAAEKAKPNGLLIIKPDQMKKFLEPLDIEDLPGIGPKTAEKLRAIEINKIKELKRLSKIKLEDMFGVVGETIYERARGIDEEPVSSEEIIKSIGKEHTFEKDTRDPEIIFNTFEKIIEDVYQELKESNFSFKTITVICRFSGFETHTKSKTEPQPLKMGGVKVKMRTKSSLPTLKEPTKDLEILKKEAKKLLLKFLLEPQKLVRLIGLCVKIC
jgi:nucleotidyltransferase/DNA polymerase involved in DNA repair